MILRTPSAKLFRDVADGIHRLEVAHTNTYLVETGDRLLVVDAGLPAAWPHLLVAVRDLGYTPATVEALLLTHGHFDHVGTAARMHREWGTPVSVHPGDRRLAAHPYSYRPQTNRLGFVAVHPGGLLPSAGCSSPARPLCRASGTRSRSSPAPRSPGRRGSSRRRATPTGTWRCTSPTGTRWSSGTRS